MEIEFLKPKITGKIKLPLHIKNQSKVVHVKLSLFDFDKTGRYHVLEFPGVSETPMVRIEAACTFAMCYGSLLCDCSQQLEMAKDILSDQPGGLLIYCLDENGRGIGDRDDAYEKHIKVYMEEQQNNVDTVDAHTRLGFPIDGRKYDNIIHIFNTLGIKSIKLLTNNPNRILFFTEAGYLVERIPLLAEVNEWNKRELTTKKEKLGHLLKLEE